MLRGGYGLYWAPFNYPIPSTSASNYGQVGFSQNTILTSSRSNPTTFENPFPTGIELPSGNSRGALTNLDSNISYVDQNRTAPRVQQFSVDLQRELPGNMGLTVSYMGARSDHIGLGGSNDIGVNINQLDPKYLALGSAALDAAAAEPVPRTTRTCRGRCRRRRRCRGPACSGRSRSTARSTPGRSPKASAAITPAVIELTKRMSNGLGGRFSYTYSQLKDNQVGETNFYAAVSPGLADEQLQLHSVDAGVRGRPAVHDRLLRSAGRVRLQHARRAAPRPPCADRPNCRSARASAGRTAAPPIC